MRTEIQTPTHPTVGHIAYGLDMLPFPGYFISIFDKDGEFVTDLDTRTGMSLSGSERVHRLTIRDKMAEFSETPAEDLDAIAGDLPVGR